MFVPFRTFATQSRPLLGRFTVLPIELGRVQSGRKVKLRDYETQVKLERFSYDLKLHDGMVLPAEGDDFIGPNGCSLRPPLSPTMQEVVRNFRGPNIAISIIPAGTALPKTLTLLHEHSDHWSLQCTQPMTLDDLNNELTEFIGTHSRILDKKEFVGEYPFELARIKRRGVLDLACRLPSPKRVRMSPSFSELLGFASIGCWLGAQLPQILTNIQLQSCEGLALPFLANWFLGDASNLLGCILTGQLAFQTWLACYFVTVDIMLVGQYFYYERSRKRPMSTFGRGRLGSTSDRHYRTLSAVAANVSGAAAVLAQQHGQDGVRRSVDRMSVSRVSDDLEVDESALAAMADSVQSEGVLPSRKRVSWSTERHGRRGTSVGATRSVFIPRLTPADDGVDRGRSLQRDEPTEALSSQAAEAEAHRRGSRASRRGANLVFLSLFALYGMGSWTAKRMESRELLAGRVIASAPVVAFIPPSAETPSFVLEDLPTPPPHHEPIPSDDPFNERVLGRIFAWLCTTLYLTSRLPQIWKNFVRKSVEGLSMYLFIFAFLGNTFYVLSIVTSEKANQPPPVSTEFFRESLPYLLGSGGTLMFDVTIVSQSVIYRRPKRHGRMRTGEESAALLAGEV
ncbi:hypothetical protein MKEN_01224700 [Mycena kentingensis (nom. inval.)]|nr:hypothetical protein MKEN_01224700 [Mycena kentingensis (nom. inval.)]